MNSTLKSLVFWMALIVIGAVVWNFSTKLNTNAKLMNFSEFMTHVDNKNVGSVTITGNEIQGITRSNDTFRTTANPG